MEEFDLLNLEIPLKEGPSAYNNRLLESQQDCHILRKDSAVKMTMQIECIVLNSG